jgi:hypothetical protein
MKQLKYYMSDVMLFYISLSSKPINTLCMIADRERFSAFGVDHWETGGVAVGLFTTLLAGRSRIQLPMVSLQFFIDIFIPAALWPWGRLNL